jgi:non-ribosomal peptide synthetase component F
LRQRQQAIGGFWVYRTDLFDRSTILRIARQFETLLRCAASQPETRLSSLEILSDEEKQREEQERQSKKQAQLNRLMATVPKTVQ